VTCKRAVGEACPNIPAFNDEFVDGFKEKGLIRQQALIEIQRAQTLKDVDDPKRDVAGRYDIRVEDDDVDSGDTQSFTLDNYQNGNKAADVEYVSIIMSQGDGICLFSRCVEYWILPMDVDRRSRIHVRSAMVRQ
jgi:hypothetical protein